jgi:hypothetical protein
VIYLLIAFKNGADYYIEYFSKKYVLNLQELDSIEENLKGVDASNTQSDDKAKANDK